MNWYIGQDIVAIVDHPEGKFKRGDEFTIKGLKLNTCRCCKIVIDIGHREPIKDASFTVCPLCQKIEVNEKSDIWWFYEFRFAPLNPMKEAISNLLEESLTVKIEKP